MNSFRILNVSYLCRPCFSVESPLDSKLVPEKMKKIFPIFMFFMLVQGQDPFIFSCTFTILLVLDNMSSPVLQNTPKLSVYSFHI